MWTHIAVCIDRMCGCVFNVSICWWNSSEFSIEFDICVWRLLVSEIRDYLSYSFSTRTSIHIPHGTHIKYLVFGFRWFSLFVELHMSIVPFIISVFFCPHLLVCLSHVHVMLVLLLLLSLLLLVVMVVPLPFFIAVELCCSGRRRLAQKRVINLSFTLKNQQIIMQAFIIITNEWKNENKEKSTKETRPKNFDSMYHYNFFGIDGYGRLSCVL